MKIVVLVKDVPDTYGDRKLNLETGLADRDTVEMVMDEVCERSLEVALSYARKNAGTEVVVLSMTPSGATATVRKALAMGAASAVQVVDDALTGADLGLTAEVLAAALTRIGFDLVIAGNQSTDGSGGVIAAMIAELLDTPQLSSLSSVAISEGAVSGLRASDGASLQVSAEMPAVISITEALPEARFPSFKDIMSAKKKPIETLSLKDLGVSAEDPEASRSIVIALSEKPPRAGGTKIVDMGDAGEQLADFLIQNQLT
ncbi:electron transfer flavoprotein subunit beta/FixA family protein [Arthrobacter sp. NtRootA1]|uniref:electron transfer flavoprotein subunit beta/FixA family protein n=1 Tax=Micrococcaceae TaxID=1268 RepID=UPI001CC37250|nr:electron transfer flavoprotein subunit beta/FixA family protein [Arthrobacter sp. NtRootA1]BCW05875.1 electron transfer flavoprotein subunit beta [Arthrobacter sp. NtRootA1]